MSLCRATQTQTQQLLSPRTICDAEQSKALEAFNAAIDDRKQGVTNESTHPLCASCTENRRKSNVPSTENREKIAATEQDSLCASCTENRKERE
jgi:hypothetical protein